MSGQKPLDVQRRAIPSLRKKFTADELIRIRQLRDVERLSSCQIAAVMGSTTSRICNALKGYPLTKTEKTQRFRFNAKTRHRTGVFKGTVWTSNEDRMLVASYPSKQKNEVLDLLPGRTWDAVKIRARYLGLSRHQVNARTIPSNISNVVVKLRKVRAIRHMHQIDLAKKLGVSATTICNYENGHHEPSLSSLLSWASALDCDVMIEEKTGRVRRGKIWTVSDISILSDLLLQGETFEAIARVMRRNRVDVVDRAIAQGLYDGQD